MTDPAALNGTDHEVASPLTQRAALPFPVVGVGASAGGLAAVTSLLHHLPADTGMAFVVVLHLSPQHESAAASLLQKATRMPVQQVVETTPVAPDHVYVIAPGQQLLMEDAALATRPLDRPLGRNVAVDLFFRSLARTQRERAMAVVLSGTGSDGAVGVADMKEQGGLTLVQAPDDAEYEAMPQAAIATGQADFVLPVADLADKLVTLWHNASRIELPADMAQQSEARPPRDASAAVRGEQALQAVMQLLHARTGNDFQHYKRATVLRRLERRLQVNGLPDLAAYRTHLEQNQAETVPLLRDMLISVTSFFRDRDAFEALERELMPRPAREEETPAFRAWSVGCATGEEAYSLAMLLNDHVQAPGEPGVALQVFGSDIDEQALAVARTGRYPGAIVTDVPPTRLRQYFSADGDAYRVRKPLREQIMFCRHNVLHDPPFSRLDLIACRNVLIYLEREVQAQVLEVFHFALRPGGLLFLGSAETAESAPGLFQLVDKKHRIYRAAPVQRRKFDLPALRSNSAAGAMPAQANQPPPMAPLERLHLRLLEQHARHSVVIDNHHMVLHLSGGVGRYLRLTSGALTSNLLALVLPELAPPLRTALLHAGQTGRRVAARPVPLPRREGPAVALQMTVVPDVTRPASVTAAAAGAASPARTMLVVFEEVDLALALPESVGEAPDPELRILQAEVARLQAELTGSIGESVISTEELRASNEELQSMNEEMRSAAEELESSKEELQSVNEELVTVNYELKAKVDEMAKINDDLSNLIASMNIATVFVDRALRIKRFTPPAREVFNILGSDVGRPLLDLSNRLSHDGLADDIEEVLRTLQPLERELRSDAGRWYLMRISAYRTNEDRIDGAVLNFIDISERRRAQDLLRARDERLRLVAENTRDYAIVTLDENGLITTWNKGAELMFGFTDQEVLGQSFRLLFVPEDRSDGTPERELATALREGRALDERWHQRKDGTRLYCSGTTTPFTDGEMRGFAKIARDLTERQLLERQRDELLQAEQQVRAQLQAANSLRSEFLAVMSHELKNPLNVVLINTELIRRSPQALGSEPLARAAETIRKTVKGQAQIIDDLLDLSRLETGKLSLERAAVDYRPVVERIVDALSPQAAEKDIAVALQVQDMVVHADIVRLEQIVWNLASNAVKYTQPGGAVRLTLVREGALARLDVTDNGPGIEPGFMDSMFNMFEQGDNRASTRREGGLGIGLALVKQLTELHGGHVEGHSEGRGRGSRFTVWLPLCEDSGSGAADEGAGPHELAGRRILLVEDNADTLDVLAELLRMEGAEVAAAMSAPQALALAESQDFDLVVSDIAMPGMDGHQLVRELRRRERSRSWPAIAVTGFGRPADAQRAAEAGFDAHIAKPLSLEALVAAARPLLRQGP
ncbi:CheR family methyltransferase [Aquincola tertiaricarbonis]|uniref:CheR family methyltransferase n=1 Tax=Aquincola tertiaricarbonis TaxID=391953 RepID=UPI000AD849C1|nr:chemotaxis protein CheB [Aquincola tertiaricarbonis]